MPRQEQPEALVRRIIAGITAKGPVELTIADVQSWFPEYSPRQVTHAVNKLHTKGQIARWDWPLRADKAPRFITTPALLDEALSVMKVDLPEPVAALYAAFGTKASHRVRVEPVRDDGWRVRRKPGVVAYRGVGFLR